MDLQLDFLKQNAIGMSGFIATLGLESINGVISVVVGLATITYLVLSAAKLLKKWDDQMLEYLSALWPVAVGFVSLVIILAKMHYNIESLTEKVKVLFDFHNKRDKK